MATLPNEQITQRTHRYGVGIVHDHDDNSPGEVLWAGTTLGNTVTLDKDVAANQENWQVMEDRLKAADDAQP